jgi:hypothetical protein
MMIIGFALLAIGSWSKRASGMKPKDLSPGFLKFISGAADQARGRVQNAKHPKEDYSSCAQAAGTPEKSEKWYKAIGKCCGKYPDSGCSGTEVCKPYWDNTDGFKQESESDKKLLEAFCDAYCSEIDKKPDQCPALSTGAIVGIVIAVVVVVGAAVGAAVFFLVIKKKGDE